MTPSRTAAGARSAVLARQLTALRAQGCLGPASLASAVWWQGLRRSVLLARSEHPAPRNGQASADGPRLTTRIGWVEILLETASPVSEQLANRLARRPTAFGRTWSRSSASLMRMAPPLARELVRRQHLHLLAARLWQQPADSRTADALATICKAASRAFRPVSLRRGGVESVDLGLLAISLLLAIAALRRHAAFASDTPALPVQVIEARVAQVVIQVLDQLFADPQNRGPLTDLDHLGCVVARRALLAALEPAGDDRSQRRHLRRIAHADQWIARALTSRSRADDARSPPSTGLQGVAIEWLALAGLVQAGGAETPPQRWQRLRLLNPPLALALASVVSQTRLLRRPDGTLPRLGEHDGSRVLRTIFRSPAASCRETLGPDLEARAHELDDSDDALVLTTRIFGTLDLDEPVRAPLPIGSTARERPPYRGFEWADPLPVTALTPVDAARLRTAFPARASILRHAVRYRQRVTGDRWRRIDRIDSAGLIVARADGVVVTLRSGRPSAGGKPGHYDHLASDIWTDDGILSAVPGSVCVLAEAGVRTARPQSAAHFSPIWQLDWGAAPSGDRPMLPLTAARLGHQGALLWGELSWGDVWFGRTIALEDGWLSVLDVSCSVPLEPFPQPRDPVDMPAEPTADDTLSDDTLLLPVLQKCPA